MSATGERMRNLSAVLYGPRDLRIEDRPVPQPGPNEVLVRVQATGICGSDVHYYEHGRIGPCIVESPMVVGHESAGVIVQTGVDVDVDRCGQTVALEPGIPCGTCRQCRLGRYNLCPDVKFFATPPVDGSITEFVAIDARFAHEAPPGMTAEHAAMAEPVSVGVSAVRKAGVTVGDRVLVTGAGPVGLFAAQVARAYGSRDVTVSDIRPYRRHKAARLGFETSDGADLTGRFDVVLECSGAQSALDAAMHALAPAARVILIGMGTDRIQIDAAALQSAEATIAGLFRYANTYDTALALIRFGAVLVDPVITHRFSLEQAETALTLTRQEPESLKAIVLGPRQAA